jgi:hypothetical protein
MTLEQQRIDATSMVAKELRQEEEKQRQEEEQRKAAQAQLEQEKAAVAEREKSKNTMNMFERAQANIDDQRAAKKTMQPSQYGLTENTIELIDSVKGGIAKTYGSIMTFPERAYDMTTGAYQREVAETGEYKPEFDPLGLSDYDSGTRTWWGKLTEMGVHFSGMAGAVKKVPGVGPMVQRAGLKGDLAVGFVSDALSSTSQEGNISQEIYESKLLERVPLMGAVLQPAVGVVATKDSDHPWLKTLKNAVEGMGADVIVSKLLRGFTNGKEIDDARKADVQKQKDDTAIEEMTASQDQRAAKEVEIQQFETEISTMEARVKGIADGPKKDQLNQQLDILKNDLETTKQELENGKFSAYVNQEIADPWLGAPNSRAASTIELDKQAKRLDDIGNTPGMGSTDAIFTPAQANRMATQSGLLDAELDKMGRELLTDKKYQEEVAKARAKGQTFTEHYKWHFDRLQETMGRHATAVDAEDFWKPFFEDPANIIGGDAVWSSKNVIAADLVNASLFSQLRDLGIASRELVDVADIMDTDGPMKTIADRLIIGLTNVKRSRYLQSAEFRALQGKELKEAELKNRTEEIRVESEFAVNTMMDMAQKSDNDALARALAEAFSMSNKIQNWKDLDAYMRTRLTSMGVNANTGLMIKELQSVMTHSILSGPKTPMRAVMGTSTASLLRPANTVLGAAMRRDWDSYHANLATINAFTQTIPEAFKLFRTNLNSYWNGDVANIKTRFQEAQTRSADEWAFYGDWVERNGTLGDKAAYHITNIARGLNDSKFLTYSTSIMGATDDAFKLIMGRGRAREKAMRLAQEQTKKGIVPEVTPELLRKYEDNFYDDLLDMDGNVDINSDTFLKSMVEEATLTKDLDNLGKALEDHFTKMPFTKPFFLFARTGINGLMVSYKNMPGIGLLHKEFYDINKATPDDLMAVAKYGITTAEDLANAKAMYAGRQAVGGAVTSMAAFHYMNGGLTGNGPQNRQQRQLWQDTGWQPRSIKIGDTWVSYDSFEPFNLMFATIADIGDNMKLMGPQWAEQNLATVALAVAGTVTSKTYLSALTQLVDALSLETKGGEKILGQLMNNTVPLASLRNELGKVFNPNMREINNSIGETLRNRNLMFEEGPFQMPVKYDMLNGEPIREWNFIERMWNAFSPVNLKMDDSPGRELLWNSGYDLRLTAYTTPDDASISLKDHPQLRSYFQQELGRLNLEGQLNELAKDKRIKESVKLFNEDVRINSGVDRRLDPMESYHHNLVIKNMFESARKKAWANVLKKYPEETAPLYAEDRRLNILTEQKLLQTKLLNMPK